MEHVKSNNEVNVVNGCYGDALLQIKNSVQERHIKVTSPAYIEVKSSDFLIALDMMSAIYEKLPNKALTLALNAADNSVTLEVNNPALIGKMSLSLTQVYYMSIKREVKATFDGETLKSAIKAIDNEFISIAITEPTGALVLWTRKTDEKNGLEELYCIVESIEFQHRLNNAEIRHDSFETYQKAAPGTKFL